MHIAEGVFFLPEKYNIYGDIAKRTAGDIYIGVVGPVRTGKSTFVRRIMEIMVLPGIENEYDQQRMRDELPQSGAGRTIMTSQPVFVPNKSVDFELQDHTGFRMRMVDCVGYMVKGASGHMEGDLPRMVQTPWYEEDIPFEDAAELGTRKVMQDHSTIGVVVTTDGTVADIPRASYLEAEERVVNEMKDTGKPFVVVLNSLMPMSEETTSLKQALENRYGVPVIALNVMRMNAEDIDSILTTVLYEFPIESIRFDVPSWIQGLPDGHWAVEELINSAIKSTEGVNKLRDAGLLASGFDPTENIEGLAISSILPGQGTIDAIISIREGLYYDVLSEQCGCRIDNDYQLFHMLGDLIDAKQKYEKVAVALTDVMEEGYGVVPPALDEMILEEPEIVKQGGRFGVRLKASAPSLHFIRADIKTEVCPLVGTEQQSEELIAYLLEEFENDPAKLWGSNIFGKSLNDLVKEGLANKLTRMPEDAQYKMQETLQRIINDGSGGLICIIL